MVEQDKAEPMPGFSFNSRARMREMLQKDLQLKLLQVDLLFSTNWQGR
ncbi:hypothetical protein [Xanthomonas nasturtii]|nr:hypothetical protein [Xanthomonas nasturtii]MCL1527883.1 hypothetical protein [Xanthomonas nasturtii]MCL1545346.1 hypothetical protein [Xanthomonas nasturtii]